MKYHLSLLCAGLACTAPSLADAQLISDRAEGMRRRCLYAPPSNLLSDTQGQRVRFVGLGENCPATYPATTSGLPAPPTARLRSNDGTDICVYEQDGVLWSLPPISSGICALFAGQAGQPSSAATRPNRVDSLMRRRVGNGNEATRSEPR